MRIELKDVGFSYNKQERVLNNISFTIEDAGLVCIIGPNGVGKSTVIKCINKLLKPDSGSVTIDGNNVSEMSYKEISEYIGYVPVASNDYFPMTVIETVMMGRHPKQKLTARTKEDFDAVFDILELLHIEHLAMKNFGELSAGQHQRVAIARGLAQDPKILMLDEPTANLDARYQMMVTRMLRDLAHEKGICVLMISHDLNIASRFADNVILMAHPGIVYRMGCPTDVITSENIRYAYGVDCEITNVRGRPHVILLDELSDDEVRSLHDGTVPED